MVMTYDPQVVGAGLSPTAEGGMPGAQQDVVPTDVDDAALADGGQADEAATDEADAPSVWDSLDDETKQLLDSHYESQYQARFQQDKAAAMAARDRENNQLRMAQNQLEGQVMAHQAALNRAFAWMAQKAQESGDELSFYQFRDEAAAALNSTAAQHQNYSQEVVGWVANQYHTINQIAHQESIGPNGQQLFDPNDPDIQAARDNYLQAAHRDKSRSRPDPLLTQQAIAADQQVRMILKQKRDLALMGAQSQVKQAKAKESAAAIQARKDRGAQSVGKTNGASGGMQDQAAWDASMKEYPSDKGKQFARYLQLKHPQR